MENTPENNKMIALISTGVTRHVILIGKYAVKIPRLNYGFALFLRGLQGNMQENIFGKMGDKRMCPVLWASKGGFILIMPRCKLLSDAEFKTVNIKKFHPLTVSEACYNGVFNIPVEFKKDSFGWHKFNNINAVIVALDYGS